MKKGVDQRNKNLERASVVKQQKASIEMEIKLERCGQEKRPVKVPLEVTTPKTSSTRSKAQVQTYEPPPMLTTTSVFVVGCLIIVLASIWTPLAVVFVWIAARCQRYCFRVNDEPSNRRRLLKDFQRTNQLTAPLRHIPDGTRVEESYWVNRRYASLFLQRIMQHSHDVFSFLTPLQSIALLEECL
jgi:hypothetical protein